jgi:signal transduction histidine kinase
MEECLAFIRGFAAARDIDVHVEVPEGETAVRADPRRSRQVACNLLTNAVKFSEAGTRVGFRASVGADEVVFVVEDQGPGVAPEHQQRIFDEFFRVQGDREGTGLGLPLAKRLVEAQGGRIWLESEPGSGCRFYFSLPVAGNNP